MSKFCLTAITLLLAGTCFASDPQFCFSGAELTTCDEATVTQPIAVSAEAPPEPAFCYAGVELVPCAANPVSD